MRSLRVCLLICLCASALSCVPNGAAEGCRGTVVQLRQPDRLTVGTDFAYPPFAFEGPEGGQTGFEVELIEMVAEEMGLGLLLVNRGATALVPGALAHRHDLAASGLRNTDEVIRQTCASDPYLEADLGLLTLASETPEVSGVGDLSGRSVAVTEGGPAESWARSNLDGAALTVVPTADDLFTALRDGSADAALDEYALTAFAVQRDRGLRLAGRVPTGESYVFITAPDNGGLMVEINAVLADLESNGTLPELRRKWFGG